MNTIEKALARERQKKRQQADKDSASFPVAEDAIANADTAADAPAVQVQPEEQHQHETHGNTSSNFFNIDVDHLDRNGFLSLINTRSRKNDEYRAIKRKLLKTAFGPLSSTLTNSNVIMVSSARPNEGKTYTAINLALSIALEQDKTVLLVDADVLRPSIARELGLDSGNGLMEYLLGECPSLTDVIYHTNIDKLRIIPAGKSHHLSTELLSSEKMLKTVGEFSSRYSDRVVIIDTPPLLGINETAVLANLAGQAVIVVEENQSKLQVVKDAVNLLSPDMAKGFVINKSVRNSGASSDYYYGYYYGNPSE
ncbi:XrtA-associated tyrosine autokinase [Alteromonas oceanisediminis]|uniref:XrtA-associated tyrosine autokinase n=1 Tax=Alteromonas oceanisediminis TaxID=2836180 RepID=UPI001BDA192A|nr:XrtA-associated tyrosine autokinase [Alteromonas oceanisediminis]MBT0585658.1 XrtA-associated tyrosine autokinase [Alteromonas oceanisediminis]